MRGSEKGRVKGMGGRVVVLVLGGGAGEEGEKDGSTQGRRGLGVKETHLLA